MPFINISTVEQLNAELEKANSSGQGLVLYFTATWCGPCRAIAPVAERLGNQSQTVTVLKIDIDQCMDHPMVKTISSVPHFKAMKGGQLIKEFSGASASGLESLIKEVA